MIQLLQDNIIDLDVDAIVNAANSRLMRGGGVCGAIHKAAGPELEIESLNLAPCPTGSAKITGGYRLKAKFVIHAVGPIYHENPDEAPALLESAYRNSLELAKQHKIESIAFPCISTGIYGFPKVQAAVITIKTVQEFLKQNEMKIIFCCFEKEDFEIYQKLLDPVTHPV